METNKEAAARKKRTSQRRCKSIRMGSENESKRVYVVEGTNTEGGM